MLFVWLTLAGFILLLSPQQLTVRFKFAFARIFRWPLTVGRNITLARTEQNSAGLSSKKELQYRNAIANLTQRLLQEHQRLEALARMRDRLKLHHAPLVPAEVITASLGGQYCELIINRGSEDGIRAGQFVVGDNSIIGIISQLGTSQARVKLFTDPSCRIEVKIADSPIYRVMQGTGCNSAKIQMVSRKHKVRKGDPVFVCSKPGLLDAPRIIGVVARCKPDDEKPLIWDITVEPVCDFKTLTNVAVIVMNPEEQIGN